MPDFDSDHGVRSDWCNVFVSNHGVRCTQTAPQFLSDHGVQCMQGTFISDHGIKCHSNISYTSDHGIECTQVAQSFVQAFFAPEHGGVLSQVFGKTKGQYGVKLTLRTPEGTHNLTPYLKSWNISQQVNQATSWSVILKDPTRQFNPQGSGFYTDKLNGANYSSGSLEKYLELEVRCAGESWFSPRMIMLRNVWKLTSSGAETSLSGTDLSDMLLRRVDLQDDFVNMSAKAAVSQILATVGIKHRLNFRDYTIPRFTPKGGTALDYITKILWVVQAEWFFDRDVFVARDRKQGGSDWTCVDKYHITDTTFTIATDGIKNQQHILKLIPAANELADYECVGGQCIGFNDITLNQPSFNANYEVVEVVNGAAHTPVWYDKNDNPVWVGPQYIGGPHPATKLRLQYEPKAQDIRTFASLGNTTVGSWVPRLKVLVHGAPWQSKQGPVAQETEYDVTVNDMASQNLYGVKPADGPIEDQMIPDAATAQYLGEALNDETHRQAFKATMQGPLQPKLKPGSTIKFRVLYGGIDKFFRLESITRSGDANNAMMDLNLSLYPGQ